MCFVDKCESSPAQFVQESCKIAFNVSKETFVTETKSYDYMLLKEMQYCQFLELLSKFN